MHPQEGVGFVTRVATRIAGLPEPPHQGWARASSAVMRRAGCGSSRRLMRSRSSGDACASVREKYVSLHLLSQSTISQCCVLRP